MSVRRIGVFLAGFSLLMAVVGAGAAQAQAGPVRVEMSEFAFEPSQIRVGANQPTTLNLVNVGEFPHTMLIAGPSGEIRPEGSALAAGDSVSWTVRLTQPGTYAFWCPVRDHRERGMEGTIVVAGAQAAPAQIPSALPRTGVADPAPIAATLGAAGSLLFGLGWALKRRRPRS